MANEHNNVEAEKRLMFPRFNDHVFSRANKGKEVFKPVREKIFRQHQQ